MSNEGHTAHVSQEELYHLRNLVNVSKEPVDSYSPNPTMYSQKNETR